MIICDRVGYRKHLESRKKDLLTLLNWQGSVAAEKTRQNIDKLNVVLKALDEEEVSSPFLKGQNMESWREVWRKGFAPLISTEGLKALADALAGDDPRLLQGATTSPYPLQCVQERTVEAACGIGYCGWKGDGLETVAEVEEFFSRVCFEVDMALGEPAGCRWFLNWFDETPRDEMRSLLLPEVLASIEERGQK